MTVFANTRMYSVNPATKAAWQQVLRWCLARAGLDWPVIDNDPPASISALWARNGMGVMQMCGLPYAVRDPVPRLNVAPVPSPARYGGRAVYFSDLAVRADAPFHSIADTFGKRIGWTLTDSQSGNFALRCYLLQLHAMQCGQRGAAGVGSVGVANGTSTAVPGQPLFGEVVPRLGNPRGVIQALLDGRIDVGPLDSCSHDLIRHTEPDVAKNIRVLTSTTPMARADYALTRERHDAVLAAPEVW